MDVTLRQPGAWKGRIQVSKDFDEFTDSDEADWYTWHEEPPVSDATPSRQRSPR
jgi:hypothetical protein